MSESVSNNAQTGALSRNMKLLAHHNLDGYGGLGEGISMQQTSDGRRILWLAHESAPKNFTGVDVTDPHKPVIVIQTALPHPRVRSNSLDVCGDLLAVAYQTQVPGLTPAGFDLFDISTPERPRLISHFDCSGPHSRGVHALWFVDGKTVHMSSGAADFTPTNPLDDQFYRVVDVSEPKAPRTWTVVVPRNKTGRSGSTACATEGLIRYRLSSSQHERISGSTRPSLPRLH